MKDTLFSQNKTAKNPASKNPIVKMKFLDK